MRRADNIPVSYTHLIGLSPENVAETTNKGFDGQIGYQDRFGNFNFNTNFVFGYAKNRVDYKAEAQQKYEWLRETGRQLSLIHI